MESFSSSEGIEGGSDRQREEIVVVQVEPVQDRRMVCPVIPFYPQGMSSMTLSSYGGYRNRSMSLGSLPFIHSSDIGRITTFPYNEDIRLPPSTHGSTLPTQTDNVQPVISSQIDETIQRMVEEPSESTASSRRLCGTDSTSDSDTADDVPLLVDRDTQAVRIDMPGDKPSSPHDRFPKERGKALASVLFMVFAAVLNEVVLSFVHELVPPGPALPDITFMHTPYYQPGLEICEYIMLASIGSVLILILFHRHRWIILRRLMTIAALLYLMRCVTMIVTQVPKADPNFHCSPKMGENATFWGIVVRGLKMVAGLGLNLEGDGNTTLCGDYIYSGHTIVLTLSALFMGEYSPRRWRFLHLFYWIVALVGVIFLVISRGHYTLDVILSYFICTRIFWQYHTLAAHPTLRFSLHNHHRKEYWFAVFRLMEGGVQKPVPRRFDFPVQISQIQSLFRRRQFNERIE